MTIPSTVALFHGEDRAATVAAAVDAVIDRLPWATIRHVVIKPNLVWHWTPAACTHADTLAVVLGQVRKRFGGRITVGEGCPENLARDAFQTLGVADVAARFGARLLDLNRDRWAPLTIMDGNGRPVRVRMSRTVYESDCRISLAVPKTHDSVLVTLGIKNLVMGSLINNLPVRRTRLLRALDRLWQRVLRQHPKPGNDKFSVHRGAPAMNANIALLARSVAPHLTVLDGHLAMEGDGPVFGDLLPWRIAAAGTDPLAVDWLVCSLMGIDPQSVGYLHYARLLGVGRGEPLAPAAGNVAPAALRRQFRLHCDAEAQRQWESDRIRERLMALAGKQFPPSLTLALSEP
jgi:uncharacterized protein (DUF362 family)